MKAEAPLGVPFVTPARGNERCGPWFLIRKMKKKKKIPALTTSWVVRRIKCDSGWARA